MYRSRITSKGTITLPVYFRDKYRIEPGEVALFTERPETGEIIIKIAPSIRELHAMNAAILKRTKATLKDYQQGDGFRAHVKQKYEPST